MRTLVSLIYTMAVLSGIAISASAQQRLPAQPDYVFGFSLSSVSNSDWIDNRTRGCAAWTVRSTNYGASISLALVIQQAPVDATNSKVPGTAATYAGTVISGSTTQTGAFNYTRLLGFVPFFRVSATTLTGTVEGEILCWKAPFNVAASGPGASTAFNAVQAGDSTGTTPLDIYGTTSGAWARWYQAGVLKMWCGAYSGGTQGGCLNAAGSNMWACNVTGTANCTFAAMAQAVRFKEAINTVTFSATPTIDLSLGNPFLTLTGNVTAVTLTNLTAGQRLTWTICQDATGSRTFAWPAAIKGGMTIGTTASKCNVQEFLSPDGSNVYATTSGVLNQ